MPYRKHKVIFVIILVLLEISFLTSLNIYACPCLSALGVATRAHTHQCAVHCTMQPVCYTLYHTRAQWRSTLSNDTTPALCRWKKRAQYTAHSARRHRPKAQICRNYPWGGPVARRKIAPRKPGAKKGSEGALIWRLEWRGYFSKTMTDEGFVKHA